MNIYTINWSALVPTQRFHVTWRFDVLLIVLLTHALSSLSNLLNIVILQVQCMFIPHSCYSLCYQIYIVNSNCSLLRVKKHYCLRECHVARNNPPNCWKGKVHVILKIMMSTKLMPLYKLGNNVGKKKILIFYHWRNTYFLKWHSNFGH